MNSDERGDDRDSRFLEAVNSALEAGAENIDANTLARLRAARREALMPRRPLAPPAWLAPAGAFTAAAIAMLVFSVWTTSPAPSPATELADVEMLSSGEGLELYDDLDFYEWLEAADAGAAG